jgi:[protein-PII] uridylyltransferase
VPTLPDYPQDFQQRLQQNKAAVAGMRQQIRTRRAAGESGIVCSQALSDLLDNFLRRVWGGAIRGARPELADAFVLLAVGGNARRRPAPWSDVDLLMVIDSRLFDEVSPLMAAAVRDCWDATLQLGSSVRTREETAEFAGKDVQFATSLCETRVLLGNPMLAESTLRQVRSQVYDRQGLEWILKVVAARQEEWLARGNSVNQLEPDVKKSPGGLRDIQLLRWIAFVRHGNPEPQALQAAGDISAAELEELLLADEFLTSLRMDLHFAQNLRQDVLTRELQLKISGDRGISGSDPSRPVEVFMQQYFGHTSQVAAIARRVADVPRRLPLLTRLRNLLLPTRTPQGYLIIDGVLQLPPARLAALEGPDEILQIFVSAAENNARLAPELRRRISQLAPQLPEELSFEMTEQFREILRNVAGLSGTIRAMAETGVLDWLVPPFREIRNLMQFNQYHSFTVDEHTLKTLDEVALLASDTSPVGSAYKEIRHRATLHLALIMHDAAKGRAGDHSIIGETLAGQVAERLQLAANKKSMLMFLVRHHLIMPDLAFRRDIADRGMLMDFARLIGAPELLRMLYCLTVADIRAVGPDVWTDWKGELLAALYDRANLILSGRPYNHLERERIQKIRLAARQSFQPAGDQSTATAEEWAAWADQQLDALPAMYIMNQQPSRIARDLAVIQQLPELKVHIEGGFEPETEMVTYRAFATERCASGSFHRVAGILSGMGMDIHEALVCTSTQGFVIASFRVADRDFSGLVPESRIEDVVGVIADVLLAKRHPDTAFRRSGILRLTRRRGVIIRQDPKVAIDNDCSQHYTVIDVFATDTQGLLFTLASALHNLGLTVHLARIDTSVDQVVDVFYVLDEHGRKLEDPAKIENVRRTLLEEIRLLTTSSS